MCSRKVLYKSHLEKLSEKAILKIVLNKCSLTTTRQGVMTDIGVKKNWSRFFLKRLILKCFVNFNKKIC